jgi:transcriptional regulator with XRE-family HTH domain
MSAMYSKHTQENGLRTADERIPNLLLRNVRKQNGWTRKVMAEKLGVAAVSIGRWERGEVVPNQYDRDLLCKLFHMSAEELGLSGEKEIPTSAYVQESSQPDEEDRQSNRRPFSEQLRYERRIRGWSQTDVAARLNCDTKTITRWERGVIRPQPYYRQLLCELFGKNAEELGLTEWASPSTDDLANRWRGGETRHYRTARTLILDLPVLCGDCAQPGITVSLETLVIDPKRGCTTFYFRFTNRTAEDAGLSFEGLSLTNPAGDFVLGQSVGSFLLEAEQSTRLSVVFDWVLERKTLYKFNMVLIRPDKWRNAYRPIPLKF